MPHRPVALYACSTSVSPGLISEIQDIFDTSQDYPEIPPCPDYIRSVPDVEWSIRQPAKEVYKRHRESHVPEYLAKPIVILDDLTASDKSVLVVAPVLEQNGEFVLFAVRFAASKVVGAAMNIEISNQDILDYLDIEANGYASVTKEECRL